MTDTQDPTPEQPASGPDPEELDAITARRQPGYDAVYAYIRSTNRVPGDVVTRNAMIWNAVHAALDALNVGCCVSSHCVEGDHVLILDPASAPVAAEGVVCDCGYPIRHLESECGGDTEPFTAARTPAQQAAVDAPCPDDTDLTEADIDRMMADAVPVQIVNGPPPTYAKLAPCSGEEGLCGPHGYHRHTPAPEPGLRERIAAAIYLHRYGTQPTGETWNGARDDYLRTADAVLNVRDAELEQLRAELAQWYAADSADAAAGSYAGRAEAAEQQRDQLRDLLREVLNTFARVTAPPNPNALGYQGASIAPADFERWQAALDQPQERP